MRLLLKATTALSVKCNKYSKIGLFWGHIRADPIIWSHQITALSQTMSISHIQFMQTYLIKAANTPQCVVLIIQRYCYAKSVLSVFLNFDCGV